VACGIGEEIRSGVVVEAGERQLGEPRHGCRFLQHVRLERFHLLLKPGFRPAPVVAQLVADVLQEIHGALEVAGLQGIGRERLDPGEFAAFVALRT
jgi:hypothetical protein